MTKFVNPPPNPERRQSWRRVIARAVNSPRKIAGSVMAIAALGGLGYWAVAALVKHKLPPFLENQIGRQIERPIDLGEVKSFSLTGIEFGKTVIPATKTDSDHVTVEGVKVGFNIFPLVFRRTLPLQATLVQPKLYLEQDQYGEWLNLDFLNKEPQKQKKPLVYLDLELDVDQAQVEAVPYQQESIYATADGQGRWQQKQAALDYDFNAKVAQAQATLQGATDLKVGRSDTKLRINDLALSDVAPLLPIPVQVDQGLLKAELDIDIPSWSEFKAADIQGNLELQELRGVASDLDAPFGAKSQLRFTGRQGQVLQTLGNLGNVQAEVKGNVGLDSGYNLDVTVLPFALENLPSQLAQAVPVPVAGELTAQVKLQGELDAPQITGSVNNTRLVTVAQTPLQTVEADFRADLAQVVLEEVKIIPAAGGEVTATGAVTTNLDQVLAGQKLWDTNQLPLELNFAVNLPTPELLAPYYQMPSQVALGKLQGQGEISGNLEQLDGLVQWNLPDVAQGEQTGIVGSGEVIIANQELRLKDTQLDYGVGKVKVKGQGNLATLNWQADLVAKELDLRPFAAQLSTPSLNLDQPLDLLQAQGQFRGRFDQLNLEQITARGNLDLDVNGGQALTVAQLRNGRFQTETKANNIELNPYVANLPASTTVPSGLITTSGRVKQLLALSPQANLNSLKADADLDLLARDYPVEVKARIAEQQVFATASSNQVDLNRLFPALPVPAAVQRSQIQTNGPLSQLIAFPQTNRLDSFGAKVTADLQVVEGNTQAIASLSNNRWQAELEGQDLSSNLLLERFAPANFAAVPVDNLAFKANLAGPMQPVIDHLLTQQGDIPLTINQVTANSGEQQIQAQGSLTVAGLTKNLELNQTKLDLEAQVDLGQLPIAQAAAATAQNNQLVADSIQFQGQGQFKGRFQGQKLLSDPINNSTLEGDLQVNDLAFNNINFDSEMTGRIKAFPQQELNFQLQGAQDVIAARAVPCLPADCKLPFVPTTLELRQGEDTNQPVILQGDRLGRKFNLDIVNFPLALLNIAPGKMAGIDGALEGRTTGEMALNLDTLATQGQIAIVNPGIGYIQAQELAAAVYYDPEQNTAQVTDAGLRLGNSEYQFQGGLDLKTGALTGKLDIPEAYIQDGLTALRWFTVEDIISLFSIPDYVDAQQVKPKYDQLTVGESVARKLNQLRQINRQIQANAAAKEVGGIPTELDIRGRYQGEITLGGRIQDPLVEFQLAGDDWQWRPKPSYPDVEAPANFVIRDNPPIPIPQLATRGQLRGTTLDLKEGRIKIQEALLSLTGKLAPDYSDAQFNVANLTVDNIANFVEIPVDLQGKIDTHGKVAGTLEQPQLNGKLTFSKGFFNGNQLPEKLAGDFDYQGRKLRFNTTKPEAIQVKVELPYPIIPGQSDRLIAKANIQEEAFVFLRPLSQNYLTWMGGVGQVELDAEARLDLARPGIVYDLNAQGQVNLQDAKVAVATPFFTEQFTGSGKITLNNQIVEVNRIDGIFGEKDLTITGKFPLLKPVSNLEKPLKVDLPPGEIKIAKLYEGGIEGEIKVQGTSLAPIVGGNIDLYKGKAFIPKVEAPTEEEVLEFAETKVKEALSDTKKKALDSDFRPKSSSKSAPTSGAEIKNKRQPASKANSRPAASAKKSQLITTLDNLQINLEEFRLQQAPIYNFQLAGGLNLNGTVDQPSNIKPKGKLTLNKADVDVLSSSFSLVRNRENTIIFNPKAGILNPELDIILRTQVEDIEEQELDDVRLADSNSSEIDDPLSEINDSRTVRISLVIDGEAAEILPNLATSSNLDCNLRPNNKPLVDQERRYSAAELKQFTNCFNDNSLVSVSNRDLLNSSAVQLTSIPSLDRGEILNLLSGQFIAFANQVTNSSQSQLFDLGVNKFILTPLQSDLFYRVEDTTVKWGKKVGLDYLTVFPNLEGVYAIDNSSTINSTYNYVLNEARVEYQRKF